MSPEVRCTTADLMDFRFRSPKKTEPEHFMKENVKKKADKVNKRTICRAL